MRWRSVACQSSNPAAAREPDDQAYEKDDQEDEEQDLCDLSCARRDSCKPQDARDQCNDEEYCCLVQHIDLLPFLIVISSQPAGWQGSRSLIANKEIVLFHWTSSIPRQHLFRVIVMGGRTKVTDGE